MGRLPARTALLLCLILSACGGDAAIAARSCARQGLARETPEFAACSDREAARIAAVRDYTNARDRDSEASK